jgi:endonuclease/exonuclease/phosphatase family metal-dependent hydrolase
MIAGLAVAIPILLVMKSTLIFKKSSFTPKIKTRIATIIVIICLGTIIGGLFVESYPVIQTGDKNSVTILTYNIQQGVNRAGIKNFEDQLWVLQEVDADIIGLQESDTARIAGGNSDVVRFFANNLKLYSYYGPKSVTSTFGVALLSKYPIKNAKTFYMYSFKEWEHTREQTACIEAEITIGTITFTVFVTHLGNAGPISEQQEILSRVKGKSNVILMGDFNFKINTPQYALTTKVLVECWEVAKTTRVGPLPTNNYPIPEGRIDHIFVSPTLKENVAHCEYLGGSISDHPACYAVLKF